MSLSIPLCVNIGKEVLSLPRSTTVIFDITIMELLVLVISITCNYNHSSEYICLCYAVSQSYFINDPYST